MKHALGAAIAIVLACAAAGAQRSEPAAADLVELDVVVVDRQGQPVPGLQPQDFRVRDDGKTVDVKTFIEVDADGSRPDRARTLVLLLDDSGTSVAGTSVVQAMAERILARMRPVDDVTVVRLNNDRDEPFGDRETAMQRIAGFRGGAVPFQHVATSHRLFRVLTALSKDVESIEHRRKVVVCIGAPGVCNVAEPQPRGYNELWKPWVTALAATARANVSIYSVMPTRPGDVLMLGGGLADLTGGTGFSNTEKFDAFIDQIWGEASHYYLLGYWPTASDHEVRSIDVKVARKGIAVRARRQR